MKSIEISANDRILIIAPHPDDECIGPGGILFKYADQCDVVLLTDGRQGQGDIPPIEGKKIRKEEFIREMTKLGINSYRMLEIEDGTLLTHTDCLSDINVYEYSMVFVTGLQDDHPDHKAAFMSVKKAVANNQCGNVPRCFLYEVHTPLQHPTHFLDITNVLQEKLDLIRIHKSQLKDLPYDQLAEQSAAYRATLFRMPEKRIEVYEEANLSAESKDAISETEILLQKERLIGWTLKKWIRRLLDKELLSEWFKNENIKGVYVYGYGELGKILIKELISEGIKVEAVIDRRAEQFKGEDVPVIHIGDAVKDLPVIVTAIYEYREIEKELSEYGYKNIFSLKEILESV